MYCNFRLQEVILDTCAVQKSSAETSANKEYCKLVLPIHTAMFDQHRTRSIKEVITGMLRCEIRYHCKAVEELSAVLEAFGDV